MIARQETVICPEYGAEVLERPETSKLKRLGAIVALGSAIAVIMVVVMTR